MMAGWVTLTAAVITAVVGPMLLIWKQHRHELKVLRDENSSQHAEGRELLTEIRSSLKEVHRDLGAVGEKADSVSEAVQEIKVWVHDHEIRHAVEGFQRDTPA